MQQAIGFLAMFVIGLYLPSCTSVPTYNVKINGYTDPAAPAPFKPGSRFFVIENQQAKNPLLEKEIRGKLNKLLLTHGYPVSTIEKADYCLFFDYGMAAPSSVSVTPPDYYGSIGWGTGYGYGYGWGGPSIFVGVPLGGYPDTTTLYHRWLLIKVVEGKAYRTQKISRPVWVGEARSVGSSSDLRTTLNFLLVAEFREFGKNTGRALTMEINAQDPEVTSLTP
jgi:hypothetical protein